MQLLACEAVERKKEHYQGKRLAMTQEEKKLLLQDLCARLPYEVIVQQSALHTKDEVGEPWEKVPHDYKIVGIEGSNTLITDKLISEPIYGGYITCKPITIGIEHWLTKQIALPYLRPISSMTEEEKGELWFLLTEGRTNIELNSNGQLTTRENIELGFNYPFVCPQGSGQYVDWLNVHHFDYRGLIEKGLALEAPEGMYKIN